MRRSTLMISIVLFCIPRSVLGQAIQERPSGPPLFEFHSGFWVNLHHFLYAEAPASNSGRSSTLTSSDLYELSGLDAKEQKQWNAAVEYYASSWRSKDLLFDGGLRRVKAELERCEQSKDLADAEIPVDLKAILLSVAPIYRKHWWPRHNAVSLAWIAQVQPLVASHGPDLSESLERIYEEPWPGSPVRVDVVAYANWAGAYTTLEPTRPTVSSVDPNNQGISALEIVFHETSHGMIDKVIDAVDVAEHSLAVPNKQPRPQFRKDLWHEVLFFTSGQLVARAIPNYTPYADRVGLWSKAWSESDRVAIQKSWEPHIEDKATLQQALENLVTALAQIFS